MAPPVNTSLVGNWTFIGFRDGENEATFTSGNWAFFGDGTLAIDIQWRFPNDVTHPWATVGDYERDGNVVSFDLGATSSWEMEFVADRLILTQQGGPPADNVITLRRVQSM